VCWDGGNGPSDAKALGDVDDDTIDDDWGEEWEVGELVMLIFLLDERVPSLDEVEGGTVIWRGPWSRGPWSRLDGEFRDAILNIIN
jgi:hypothetical protein